MVCPQITTFTHFSNSSKFQTPRNNLMNIQYDIFLQSKFFDECVKNHSCFFFLWPAEQVKCKKNKIIELFYLKGLPRVFWMIQKWWGQAIHAGQKLSLFLERRMRIQCFKVKRQYSPNKLGSLQVRFFFILKLMPECESAAEGVDLLSGVVNTIQGVCSFCHLPCWQWGLFNVSVTPVPPLPWVGQERGASNTQEAGGASTQMSCLGTAWGTCLFP